MSIESRTPSVSIIILNYNGEDYIERCLSSVLNTDYLNFEVILVDNASTDGSLALVEKFFANDARIKIIRNTKNLGFSAGNNIGFEHASGRYLAFLNNDVIVDSQWLRYLIEALEYDNTIGLAQPIILNISDCKIQMGGWLYGDYFMYMYPVGKGKPASTEYKATFEVSVVAGAAMIIDRKFVEKIGLFEAVVPFYYDDTFLSFKTWLCGKRVVTVSKSKVYHAGSATTNTLKDPLYFKFFNSLKATFCLIFDVYYGYDDLVKALFSYSLSILNQMIGFLVSKRPSGVFSILDSLKWVLMNFRLVWRNRIKHWNSPEISSQKLLDEFVKVGLKNFFLNLLPSYRLRYYEFLAKQYESKISA